jgi:hypothetical protein
MAFPFPNPKGKSSISATGTSEPRRTSDPAYERQILSSLPGALSIMNEPLHPYLTTFTAMGHSHSVPDNYSMNLMPTFQDDIGNGPAQMPFPQPINAAASGNRLSVHPRIAHAAIHRDGGYRSAPEDSFAFWNDRNITEPSGSEQDLGAEPIAETRHICKWAACNYSGSFRRAADLMRHLKTTHVSPGSYVCPAADCHKSFNRKDKMDEHVRRVHRATE